MVEHRTGIAEVTGSNPVEALIFFRLLLSNCLNWKIYCNDHSSLSSITAFQIWIISYILHITPQYDRRPNCLLPLLIIERLLTERYNNFCYSILGHPNYSLTGASSSSKLHWLINMHVPALCVAYWISRHCVLMYGKYGLLTKFFFCVFIDRDEVEVYKLAKKERGQYPAILTSHLVNKYGFRGNFSCGILRVVPSEQDGSILSARVANHSTRFGSSCPLAELAI